MGINTKKMKPEKLQQLKEQHPDLEFESVDGNVIVKEKKKGRWRAEIGNNYYFVAKYGAIKTYHEQEDDFDNFSYQTGNYFRTEKEAEAFKERLITRQKVIDRLNQLKTHGFSMHILFENIDQYKKLRENFTHEEITTLLL